MRLKGSNMSKNIKWWLQYVIVPFVIASGILAYLLIPADKNTWHIQKPNNLVILLQDSKQEIDICYHKGNGNKIGIDNSNDIDPKKGNFRFIHKNNCATFGIKSGSNLGVFLLGNATYASGNYKIIKSKR